ncbi:MAG: hypothetical protein AAF412_07380, partial [Pseudomonadota bacterium]
GYQTLEATPILQSAKKITKFSCKRSIDKKAAPNGTASQAAFRGASSSQCGQGLENLLFSECLL